jgi:hypothetical protein
VQDAFKGKQPDKTGRQPGPLFGIRIEDHLKIVTYIRIAFGSLFLLAAIFLFLICSIPGIISGDHEAIAILMTFGAVLALLPLAMAVPNLVGANGLSKRRRWGRILVLIVCVPELFAFPVGTATGIYTIWILMQEETVKLFQPAESGP